MLKISICFLVLVSNFLIAQAQAAADYSESANPVAREFKIEKKPKKEKKDTATAATISNSVSIPVTVVDQQGAFVDDLTAADFKVFVDDAEVKIASFQTAGSQLLNVVFLLDMSPSADTQFLQVSEFLRKLIENLRAEDKISFITFDQELKVLNAPTNDRAIIKKAFGKIEPIGGGTALYDSMANVFSKRLPVGEKTIVVMVTDGVDTVSKKSTYVKSLDIVRTRDVPVTAFYLDTLMGMLDPAKKAPRIPGIGNPAGMMVMSQPSSKISDEQVKYEYAVGRKYLSEVASLSGGSTFAVKDYSALTADQISNLAKLIRPQYYLAFESDTAKPQGRIKIRINRPQLKINACSRY